ncbi:sigma-70 family RNA polymerase sigma factor [Glaciecola sp. XM2]|jgi:RNA polymerase sigma factor (TIGR02999 family)|uniref:ECF-type sigma factor n=1 Tax=Glaciecola sp. XM2 TaxID=1914931 RepID=UPI001BDEE607|nr:ECF-type sigma factor [Glaciecola sp. XM2]MBT1451874.1 sigma-70 family RNA polymerase sigma factor [Glaciecola sp. XM2]
MTSFSSEIASLPTALQSVMLEELHRIAARFMHSEQQGHTLQATALVNEAYLKLADKTMHIADKKHFIAIAAQQMRRILVDHARQKHADKRGGKQQKVTLLEQPADIQPGIGHEHIELIYIDELLHQLAAFDPRAAHIFELKLFSMLTHPEIAEVLGLSVATIERDIQAAKAWLKIQMKTDDLSTNKKKGM